MLCKVYMCGYEFFIPVIVYIICAWCLPTVGVFYYICQYISCYLWFHHVWHILHAYFLFLDPLSILIMFYAFCPNRFGCYFQKEFALWVVSFYYVTIYRIVSRCT